MRTHLTLPLVVWLTFGSLSAALVLACSDGVETDGSGSQLGNGGSAGSGGAGGKAGGSGGKAGSGGGIAGGGGAGGSGASTGGSSGASGVAGTAGASGDGGTAGGAGASGGGASGGSAAGSAGAGGSVGLGGEAGTAGSAGAGGEAGTAGGVGGGGDAGTAGGAGASGASATGGSAGSAGSGGDSSGAAGSGGAAGSSSGAGGAGGVPTCGNATAGSACASPLFPASAPQCLTKFDLPQPETAPLGFACFTPSVVPQHGPVGTVARVAVEATSRIVVWRSHSSSFDKKLDHMGLANDDCGGGASACLGVGTYGDIVTAEVGPGNYQIQGEVAKLQPSSPLRYLVEAPPPAPTNTSCATATPINGPWTMAMQPRVLDTQSRHFSVAPSVNARKLSVTLGSPMNIGKATARVRETCGGAVIAEGSAPYLSAAVTGSVVLTFQAAANKAYEVEITDFTPGVSFGIGLQFVP